jgi:hypothetical protein
VVGPERVLSVVQAAGGGGVRGGEGGSVEVDSAELALLLEGIDLAGAKRRMRFRLENRQK